MNLTGIGRDQWTQRLSSQEAPKCTVNTRNE